MYERPTIYQPLTKKNINLRPKLISKSSDHSNKLKYFLVIKTSYKTAQNMKIFEKFIVLSALEIDILRIYLL